MKAMLNFLRKLGLLELPVLTFSRWWFARAWPWPRSDWLLVWLARLRHSRFGHASVWDFTARRRHLHGSQRGLGHRLPDRLLGAGLARRRRGPVHHSARGMTAAKPGW